MARDTFRAEEDIIFLSCLIAFGSMMNWHAESLHDVLEHLKMKVKRLMEEQEEDEEDFITLDFTAQSPPHHSSPPIVQAGGANLAQSPDDHSTSPLIIQAAGVAPYHPLHNSCAPYHPLHNPCAPRPTFLRYGKNSPELSIHKLRPIVDIQRSEEESRAKAETEAEAKAESEAEAKAEADEGYNGEKSQVIEEYVNESHGPQLAQNPPSLEDRRGEITEQESRKPQEPDDTTELNPNSLLLLAHRINTSAVGFKSSRSVIRKIMLPLFMLLALLTVTVTSGFDLLVLDNNYLGANIVYHQSAHVKNPLPLTERVSLSQKMKGFSFLLQQAEEREEENRQTVRQSSTATLALVQEIRKVKQMQDEIGEDASRVFHLQELKQAEEREEENESLSEVEKQETAEEREEEENESLSEVKKQETAEETEPTMVSRPKNRQTVRQSSTATLALVQEIRKVEQMQDEIGDNASRVFHLQELKQAEEREDNLATENGENADLSWPKSRLNASQFLSQDLKDDAQILVKSAIEPESKQGNERKGHTIEVDSSDSRTTLSEVNRQSHLAGNEIIKSDVWGHAHCLETFEEHRHGGLKSLQSKDSLSKEVVCQLPRDCNEIPQIAELKKNEEIRLPDRDCLPHSKSDGAVQVLAVAGCDVKKEILSTPSKGEKRTSVEMNSKINCSNGEVCQDEIGEDASRVLEIACLRLPQSGLNHDEPESITFVGKPGDSSHLSSSKTANVANSTAVAILLILVAGGNRWRKAQTIEVRKPYSRNKPRQRRQQIEQTVTPTLGSYVDSTTAVRRSVRIRDKSLSQHILS